MNELTQNENTSVFDNQSSDQLPSFSSFTPSLAIVYAVSKAFTEHKITPGTFALGGSTALGEIVQLIWVDYRFRVSTKNAEHKMVSTCYHLRSNPARVENDKEYMDLWKNPPEGLRVDEGVEALVYLPESKTFAILYLKNGLRKYSKVLQQYSAGGRVVNILAEPANYKGKHYYNLKIQPTNLAIVNCKLNETGLRKEVVIPESLLTEAVDRFNKPPKVESVDAEEDDR
jgi:hypothetical protein